MIKTFKVQAEYNDLMYVMLQVDMDKLTPELATEINNFYGRDGRIESEDDDVVRAVVRLYGARAIRNMLLGGGACFKFSNRLAVSKWVTQPEDQLARIRNGVLETDCIRVIEAQVAMPDFDTVELCDVVKAST